MNALLNVVDADEARRLRALSRLGLDAVPQDPVLDGVVRMAARALRCPLAMVNIVGADSAWSIATTEDARGCLPREAAFCSTVADQRRALVVGDLSLDPRFTAHPLVVGEAHLRFYAGLPIGDQHQVLGALCVLDTEPREIDEAARQALEDLARMATHWLTSRRERLERIDAESRQREQLQALVAQRTAELEHAREAAEAASAAKSAFLATMSHEIRTPMNGVVGLIELMDQSGLPPHQQELMHAARESAHALLGLIDNILDFSKIESGRLDLDEQPFDLRRLIESSADAWLGAARQRQVALHVFVQPGLPATLLGDAGRLRQVVANLLGNAIKFSAAAAQGGRVALRVTERDGQLAIAVRDNGVGLTADAIARLFRPFEQAEASTRRRFGGTGLGLAISQRLVLAMDGRIEVRSVPQAGACFTVLLPLRPAGSARDTGLPDLAGVRCTWCGGAADGLDDWRDYLKAAGAEVVPGAADTSPAGALGTWHIERGAVRARVVLRRGAPRGQSTDAQGLLWLDADVLHRDALLQAVQRALEPQPGAAAEPPGPATPAGLPAHLAPALAPVLVAEDNPVNRLVIGRQLQRLGVPAVIVADGQEALACWRREAGRFSLLLTDLHMPGLDGEALCAAIRAEERPGSRLPVVALTANAVRGEAERAIAAGMDDYLTKPVPLERLSAALRRWLPLDAAPAEPAADSAGDIDTGAVARAVGPDPADQARMRQIYLKSLAMAEGELWSTLHRADWRAAGLVAHRIKSSSHAVGALRLARLLNEFEAAARDGLGEGLGELVPGLVEAAARVRAAFGTPGA